MTPTPAQPLTVDDVLTLRRPANVELSADGDRMVFVVHDQAPQPGESARSSLWTKRGQEPPQTLTTGDHVDGIPRLSPDGKNLAFASDRLGSGLMSPYILELDRPLSEPRLLGDITGSVEDLQWSADGRELLVLAADAGSETGSANGGVAIARAGEDEEPIVRRPREAWRRLHLLAADRDVGAREVGPPGASVWEFDWDGVGSVAVVTSTDPTESGWYDAEVAVLDLSSRTTMAVHVPRWQVQSPALSPDGERVAFVEALQSDRGVVAGSITVVGPGASTARVSELDVDVSTVQWLPDGRLFWVGVAGLGTACGFLRFAESAGGRVTAEIDERWRGLATLGMVHQFAAACSQDGSQIVAAREANGEPPEVATLITEPHTAPHWLSLTEFNAPLAHRPVPDQRHVRWQSEDGLDVEGLLLTPRDAVTPLPLVVYVHGGPTNAWTSTFAHGLYAGDALGLAEDGFVVLLPNPRGSTGRGDDFMQANLGDMGGGDLEDLLAGVRALVADGTVDPARVGITGASYGGFMAAWGAVRSHIFAASVAVSSVTNWLSFHLTTGVGRFDEMFLAGSPYDRDGPYLDRSPVMHAPGCAVPTLVLHGDADLCTPVGQAHELYQALAEAGCEVELAIYPRGGHDLVERDHLRDANLRTRAWFLRHLAAEAQGS